VDKEAFIKQVKFNCNVSDAKFWGYYSICGLLMRMRELYISEHSLMPWDAAENQEISSWIRDREALWKNVEEEEIRPLVIDGISYDPFDINGLNTVLKDSGLVYGGGYGIFRKPTFFVARLDSGKELYDYQVYYTASELCRDLSAFPAMLQGRCIYLRSDILKTILWDKFQMLKSRQYRGLIEEMFSEHGIKKNDVTSAELFKRIDDLSHVSADLFVLHEVGEAFEDDYTEEWLEILHASINNKYCELYLRGTKDLLADTSNMGPLKAVIQGRRRDMLKIYMTFLDGIRRELFPEIRSAFQHFVESDEWAMIERARLLGYRTACELREKVLTLWKERGDIAGVESAVREYIKKKFSA